MVICHVSPTLNSMVIEGRLGRGEKKLRQEKDQKRRRVCPEGQIDGIPLQRALETFKRAKEITGGRWRGRIRYRSIHGWESQG